MKGGLFAKAADAGMFGQDQNAQTVLSAMYPQLNVQGGQSRSDVQPQPWATPSVSSPMAAPQPAVMQQMQPQIATPQQRPLLASGSDQFGPTRYNFASGGEAPSGAVPWVTRAASQRMSFAGGLLNSAVPGRTDKLNLNVPSGSYVVPSSVVSFLGQDNSQAGGALLDKMFKLGGGGRRSRGNFRMPGARNRRRSAMPFAEGGTTEHVPIVAAGGEYIIPPHALVAQFGDLDAAHEIMDEFVKQARDQHIQTLQKLPGPKR